MFKIQLFGYKKLMRFLNDEFIHLALTALNVLTQMGKFERDELFNTFTLLYFILRIPQKVSERNVHHHTQGLPRIYVHNLSFLCKRDGT